MKTKLLLQAVALLCISVASPVRAQVSVADDLMWCVRDAGGELESQKARACYESAISSLESELKTAHTQLEEVLPAAQKTLLATSESAWQGAMEKQRDLESSLAPTSSQDPTASLLHARVMLLQQRLIQLYTLTRAIKG